MKILPQKPLNTLPAACDGQYIPEDALQESFEMPFSTLPQTIVFFLFRLMLRSADC